MVSEIGRGGNSHMASIQDILNYMGHVGTFQEGKGQERGTMWGGWREGERKRCPHAHSLVAGAVREGFPWWQRRWVHLHCALQVVCQARHGLYTTQRGWKEGEWIGLRCLCTCSHVSGAVREGGHRWLLQRRCALQHSGLRFMCLAQRLGRS